MGTPWGRGLGDSGSGDGDTAGTGARAPEARRGLPRRGLSLGRPRAGHTSRPPDPGRDPHSPRLPPLRKGPAPPAGSRWGRSRHPSLRSPPAPPPVRAFPRPPPPLRPRRGWARAVSAGAGPGRARGGPGSGDGGGGRLRGRGCQRRARRAAGTRLGTEPAESAGPAGSARRSIVSWGRGLRGGRRG